MEIAELIPDQYTPKENLEIKKLLFIKNQNNQLINKIKSMDILYNNTISNVRILIKKNTEELNYLNNYD